LIHIEGLVFMADLFELRFDAGAILDRSRLKKLLDLLTKLMTESDLKIKLRRHKKRVREYQMPILQLELDMNIGAGKSSNSSLKI
jgi:hypothetical protein